MWFFIQDGGGKLPLQKRVMVSGENLTNAQQTFESGQPVVSFSFDTIGGKRFGDATAQNVGKRFAIVLDDKVISAPVIREPITGGSVQISGNFTLEEANSVAMMLRAGALPGHLALVEQQVVQPAAKP